MLGNLQKSTYTKSNHILEHQTRQIENDLSNNPHLKPRRQQSKLTNSTVFEQGKERLPETIDMDKEASNTKGRKNITEWPDHMLNLK